MTNRYDGLPKEERRECIAWLRWARRNGKTPAMPGLAQRIARINHTPAKEVR